MVSVEKVNTTTITFNFEQVIIYLNRKLYTCIYFPFRHTKTRHFIHVLPIWTHLIES